MKFSRILSILLFSLSSLNFANTFALTISSGLLSHPHKEGGSLTTTGGIDISLETTPLLLSGEYNIYTDGDMFLDYSIFSENQDLFIGSHVSIMAETVTIHSLNDAPIWPSLSDTMIFTNPSNNMNELGNILLFSEVPILHGSFEATGGLYIGNYSSLQPVPLPASALLLLSGLVMLGGGSTIKKYLTNHPSGLLKFLRTAA